MASFYGLVFYGQDKGKFCRLIVSYLALLKSSTFLNPTPPYNDLGTYIQVIVDEIGCVYGKWREEMTEGRGWWWWWLVMVDET